MKRLINHYKHKKTNLLLTGMVFVVGSMVLLVFLENQTKAENINITETSLTPSTATSLTSSITTAPEILPNYNLTDDSSFQKYLGNNNNLNDITYVPEDLVPIPSDFLANNSNRFLLRREAGELFAKLARQFRHDFNGDKLYISSAYRSREFQTKLAKNCNPAKCAKPGASEHQLGLAIDISVMTKEGKYIAINKTNKYYQRLQDNASTFGFQNTYQKGMDIDGQMEEGRHRRYVGFELAELLKTNKQTFAEYYQQNTRH